MIIRHLGVTHYLTTYTAMQQFTANRSPETPDEIWLTEHPAVYTHGLNRCQLQQPLRDDIPFVMTDRGGKTTYHGLGQIIIYPLLDLQRRNINVRQWVTMVEQSMVAVLAAEHISAYALAEAPGVYVDIDQERHKIGALGLRLKNGRCYHGLSLNVQMDLTPFSAIAPCGYEGLKVTQCADLGIRISKDQMTSNLLATLEQKLIEHDSNE